MFDSKFLSWEKKFSCQPQKCKLELYMSNGSEVLIYLSFLLYLKELERTYKPHYHYQNFSPLANRTDLNREKYSILQTHWH